MTTRHTATLIVSLAVAAAGCTPARPARPAVETLPMPLVAALLDGEGGMRNRPNREFTVGAPPPGLPSALVPSAPATAVGGVRMGDHVIAVFADSTRRVAAVLEEQFERAGFARPAATPGSGFFTGYGPSNEFCSDSAIVHVVPLTGDERHLARVTYRRMRGMSGCPPYRRTEGGQDDGASKRLELPALTPPSGARVRRSGGGGGSDEVDSRAEVVGGAFTPAALLAHYAAQLVAAGWAASPPATGERVAAQYLEATDAAGGTWTGTLIAEAGRSSTRLRLGMRRETSR